MTKTNNSKKPNKHSRIQKRVYTFLRRFLLGYLGRKAMTYIFGELWELVPELRELLLEVFKEDPLKEE